jgi:hypothetical protein
MAFQLSHCHDKPLPLRLCGWSTHYPNHISPDEKWRESHNGAGDLMVFSERKSNQKKEKEKTLQGLTRKKRFFPKTKKQADDSTGLSFSCSVPEQSED